MADHSSGRAAGGEVAVCHCSLLLSPYSSPDMTASLAVPPAGQYTTGHAAMPGDGGSSPRGTIHAGLSMAADLRAWLQEKQMTLQGIISLHLSMARTGGQHCHFARYALRKVGTRRPCWLEL